jgi:hypothetical protein
VSPFRTIFATADLLGRERYVELALFRGLGERSIGVVEPEAMLMLASFARSHAWRARLLEEQLPVSLGLPGVDEATRSPGSDADEAVGVTCTDGDGFEILDAIGRVLYPEMLSAYRIHLVSCSPAADLPVALALRRVIADLECRLDELHEVVDLGDGPLRPRATALSDLLTRLGGPFGPTE